MAEPLDLEGMEKRYADLLENRHFGTVAAPDLRALIAECRRLREALKAIGDKP